jgi:O-antigen ligase
MLFSKKIKSINYKAVLTGFAVIIILLIVVADDVNYLMETIGQRSELGMQQVIDSAQGRMFAVNQVLDNIHQYWLTGVGPGAYQVFFVNHRLLQQTAFFDHTHNDYLEFGIEYGAVALLLVALIILFVYRIILFIFKTRSRFYGLLGIGVISCLIYMLLHGTMDFNARIPANVLTIIVAISAVYGRIVMSSVHK